jgi:hypothetical protein
MVVEVAILGGDPPGRSWGVMRGVLRLFQEWKGGIGRRGARVHVRRWGRQWPFGPIRRATGWGPRVSERGQGGLAGPAKG